MQKGKNIKYKLLLTYGIIYFLIFLFIKINIFKITLGATLLTSMFILIVVRFMKKIFFSRRSYFKIYIFLFMDLLYFFKNSFSMFGILIYLIEILILVYLLIGDVGKSEKNRAFLFALIYTTLKTFLVLTLIAI